MTFRPPLSRRLCVVTLLAGLPWAAHAVTEGPTGPPRAPSAAAAPAAAAPAAAAPAAAAPAAAPPAAAPPAAAPPAAAPPAAAEPLAPAERAAAGRAEAPGPTNVLRPADAVRLALTHDPSISAAREGAAGAAAAVSEAQADGWPFLRLAGAATRYQKPMLVTPIHGLGGGSLPPFDRTILTGSATLGYLLFDGGGRGARVGEARHAESSAEAAVREAEQATIAEVLAAYLDARAAGEAVQAHDLRIEALRSERERVSRRLIEGKAARVELLRAEAAVAAAQADREAEAAGLEVAERRLATLIQEPVDSTRFSRLIAVSLRDGGIEDRNRLVQRALDSNASVARQREEARAAGSRRDAVASRRWPEVRLAGNLLLYSNAEDADAEEWNAGAQLSAPLFTGGAISSAIRRAEAGERAAAARLRATEDRVRSEIDRALAAIEETQARVRSLETAVASYEEVARIEALSLEAGSATQNDYLQAEAQLLLARANRIRAANAEVQARVALARLIGVLDPAWIEESLEANR